MRFSGDGLLARALQHETDHTRGTVFGDRLSTRWRKKLQKAHDKTADTYPADWPAVPSSGRPPEPGSSPVQADDPGRRVSGGR